ncbi:MAG TPA: phosphoribosylamine--glycine ligase [Clostridiales bacterium]|nr:phosphoribosylamine--glycine ligase [Clostridiales bacterium]
MKILVVGGGGREHAVVKKLKENKEVEEIFVLPGNGGIAADATCVPINAKDIEKIVSFATEKAIDYAVVTPDDPLALGAVDELEKVGVPCFGPRKNAAIIESSKVFAKNLMKKYGIPTARYETFSDADEAVSYIAKGNFPVVIKADGLALGKGVIIAKDFVAAENAVRSIMRDKIFGESGNRVVVEEFLEGPEVSVLAFTDGKTIKPMVSSMDHKRAKDGDEGLNTGGMGTVAPNPYYTDDIAERCYREIFVPTVNAMNAEGRTFKGCLYFGLMLTKDGPKVIEYNCRFGDPETQVVLPLLKSDLLTVMRSTTDGTLDKTPVEFYNKHACCVVMASFGYPEKYEKGYEITVDDAVKDDVYFAGAKRENGKLYTDGGRVLGVVSVADTLGKAIEKSYGKTEKIKFKNAYFRKDIGQKALNAEKR